MSVCKKPNILIIHADQHRYDCIHATGNKDIYTPNIDKLADDGVTYYNSFCSYPVCTPSRYSLLTGLHVHQHMGWSNHCTIPQELDTFPKILQKAGYSNVAVGKMHFTPTYLDVGFQEMYLAEQAGDGRYDDDYHRFLREKGLIDRNDLIDQVEEYRKDAEGEYWKNFGTLESNLSEANYSTTWIGVQALKAIEKWNEGANLLMVGFIKPHHPFDPPAPWNKMYDPDKISILPGWTEECIPKDINYSKGFFPHVELDEKKIKKVMSYYYAAISLIDYQVGKIIEILKQKKLYDNTLIIYTSDHGDFMGYHHLLLKGGYMYDPLIKVPLIIKYPGIENRGEKSDALVSNIDLAPTILELVGLKRGTFMNGLNLQKDCNQRKFVFAESENGKAYMIRSSNRKLLFCKQDEKCQFFNLDEDPFELNNIYYHPKYQAEILDYKLSLGQWIMFESKTPTYLDERAKVIDSENARTIDDSCREESIRYYRDLMTKN